MILKSPDEDRVRIRLDAYCHDCKHRHKIEVNPTGFTSALWDWQAKHAGHIFEFLTPRRTILQRFRDWMFQKAGVAPWWLSYAENSDNKIAYAATATIMITLASLASSATFVAGQEATAIDNGTNKYIDQRVTAKITTGTNPTVNTEIRIYGIAALDDTPTWPDVFDGTDSAETVTNTQMLDQLPLLGSTLVSATSSVGYPFTRNLTVAEAFGFCPQDWTIFVSHATAVALHATAGNHVVKVDSAYFTTI